MISRLSSTGHEIGGTLGIDVFSTIAARAPGALGGAQAASVISDAFVAAGVLTSLASMVASAVLLHASDLGPELHPDPTMMPIH